jgi:hypothetical protein
MSKHVADSNARKLRIVAGLTAGLLGAGAALAAGTAAADPITCPSGQVSVKTDAGWDCQNNGGNLSNAEDPRSPQKDKGDF